MKKKFKLTSEELPSIVHECYSDGFECYVVSFKGQEIYVAESYETLYAFVKGFFIGLGYPVSSTVYLVSLRHKMEINF